MAVKIKEFMKEVRAGEGMRYRNMTVFPLFRKSKGKFDYLTLEEALLQKQVDVTEKSSAGSVPEIMVSNRSDKRIVIFDGEEIIGAKQNRIINVTVIIDKRTVVMVPVTCCESGRWSYNTEKFNSGSYAYGNLRRNKTEQVSCSLIAGMKFAADQGEVWNDISRKSERLKVKSETSAMNQIYDDYRDDFENFLNAFKYVKGCCGLVVGINGKVFSLDILDKPRTMETMWQRIIKSYVLDAIDGAKKNPRSVSLDTVKKFLDETGKVKTRTYNSVGIGEDIRLDSENLVGSAVVCQGRVLHMSVFRKEKKGNRKKPVLADADGFMPID